MARRLLPLLIAAIAAIVLGLPTLVMPLHPDQALFAMVGRTISKGGFPYVDAWDFKTPGLYLIYALAIHGPSELARNVRLFDLAWTAACAALLVELGRRWWNRRAGLIAALTYALVHATDIPFWQTGQPDSLVVLPILFTLLCFDLARGRRSYLLAAGLIFGFACQLRFTVVLLLPAIPLVEALAAERGGRFRLWLGRMLWLSIGVLAFQIGIAGYLAVGGALSEALVTMRYAAGYTRLGGPWDPPGGPTLLAYLSVLREGFWNWASPRLILSAPGIAAGVAGGLMLGNRCLRQLLLFVALSYAGIALQTKFFWYHYGYVVPFLALLAGWGWDSAVECLRRSRGPVVASMTAAGIAAILLLGSGEIWNNGVDAWRDYLHYLRRPSERQGALLATSGYRSEWTVGAYLRAHTQATDTIYVWGFDPALYYLAERPTASPFLLAYPLMSDWSPPRWKQQFVQDLAARRPAYIVVHPDEPDFWIVGHDISAVDYISHYPAFQRLLADDYQRETVISERVLYRRK